MTNPSRPEIHTRELADFCQARYKAMSPLHDWLRELSDGR